MARFTDFYSDGEVKDIMERLVERFPDMFEGFDTDNIAFLTTKKKRSAKPMRLISVAYPMEALINKPYIVEIFESRWKPLNPKQKNLAVFHIMCAIPEGGFNATAKHYGKKVKPEISMYMREFAASGGVPNWMENPAAIDPMENTTEAMDEVIPSIEALPETDDGDKAGGVVRTPVAAKASKKTAK
jgi:hypothetical protein